LYFSRMASVIWPISTESAEFVIASDIRID
jgi:hypothetical protein